MSEIKRYWINFDKQLVEHPNGAWVRWQDVQKLPHKTWFVSRESVESFGVLK